MTDLNELLILDLNFRTALLESVDWDETQSDALLSYLQDKLTNVSAFPEEILNYILDNFGESAYNFVKQMFVDIYIENGLYVKPEDENEH